VLPDELAEVLQELRRRSDDEVRAAWDRSLSFGDALFDRFERAARLGFGERASIYDSALVYGDVHVGADTWIGPNVLLDGSGGGLRIGRWCAISAGVQVYTHDTVLRSVSLGEAPRTASPVVIGDGCHVGALAVVAPGVAIGERGVVGANSFVKDDVPDRAVVAGSPARVVGRVVGDGADVHLEADQP
jgi:acetyltransferase-like isoleucine patch superfamily enzyme